MNQLFDSLSDLRFCVHVELAIPHSCCVLMFCDFSPIDFSSRLKFVFWGKKPPMCVEKKIDLGTVSDFEKHPADILRPMGPPSTWGSRSHMKPCASARRVPVFFCLGNIWRPMSTVTSTCDTAKKNTPMAAQVWDGAQLYTTCFYGLSVAWDHGMVDGSAFGDSSQHAITPHLAPAGGAVLFSEPARGPS